ncbi:hypothetical protein DM02DRAFT_632149 [Periconia macrospinosa]|uniref:Uncharacterized protein n=1 Tax=Periconia macrospinosa TaxID=97972 RepID=A0A2V1DFB5_9PLEO|nr:hypothetical protein DM02DRAFT_632149 [Periconia macrospinosa]
MYIELEESEATAVLEQYNKKARESQQYLRCAVQQHGDDILTRWRKRTKAKRAALLSHAEPDLPQREDFIVHLNNAGTPWHMVRAHRKYFLPYLNVDKLVQNPSTLVGLLHARAKDSLEEWAPFDHEQLRNSWGLGFIDVDFNAGAVFMYGPRYGTLTKWEAGAAHRHDIVGYPRARLIIEAQITLLQFLKRVVEQLIVGLPDDKPASATKIEELILSGLRVAGDGACWSNFVNRPFTGPPRFDIDALVAQVKARADITSDHLWLLQTEPSYLKRHMRKIAQMETIESTGRNRIGLALITAELVAEMDINWFWRSAQVEFEHLQKFYGRYRDSIMPGSPMPKRVDDALGALELTLVNELHTRIKQLGAMVTQRPGFRSIYDSATPPVGSNTSGVMYEVKTRVKSQFTQQDGDVPVGQALAYRTERLWWILFQLQGEPDSEKRYPYPMLLDMLNEHLAISDRHERGRLDEILYEKLSDYATLLELLWTVRMHRPRNTNRIVDDCIKTEDRVIWRAAKARKKAAMPGIDAAHRATVDALATFQSAKRDQILTDTKKPKLVENEDMFLPLPSTSEMSPRLDLQAPKTKTKTRGEPGVAEETNVDEATVDETPLPTIKLPKRSYTTVRYMFPESPEERQKSIEWDTFVASMADAGFVAKNGGGSIVTFENQEATGGKIIFHRPHPDPSIDPIMLQSMGRRMNKWFGWRREMFVLADQIKYRVQRLAIAASRPFDRLQKYCRIGRSDGIPPRAKLRMHCVSQRRGMYMLVNATFQSSTTIVKKTADSAEVKPTDRSELAAIAEELEASHSGHIVTSSLCHMAFALHPTSRNQDKVIQTVLVVLSDSAVPSAALTIAVSSLARAQRSRPFHCSTMQTLQMQPIMGTYARHLIQGRLNDGASQTAGLTGLSEISVELGVTAREVLKS